MSKPLLPPPLGSDDGEGYPDKREPPCTPTEKAEMITERAFTDPDFRRHWRPYPHWHVIECGYSDPLDRCYATERGALCALTRYVHAWYREECYRRQRFSDGSWEMDPLEPPDDSEPIAVTLILCECDEDCYMVAENG